VVPIIPPDFAAEIVLQGNAVIPTQPPTLNPDFTGEFVMKGQYPIKTGVCAGFGGDIRVDYAEGKKSKQRFVLAGVLACNRTATAKSGFNP
jgi:hypothetical protein